MLLLLSKLLPLLVYPVGLAIILGLAGLAVSGSRFRRTSVAMLAAAVIVLWVSSTPLFANWLYSTLEAKYRPLAISELPQADVAILLGGVLHHPLAPRTAPDVTETFDRVTEAAGIFHAG